MTACIVAFWVLMNGALFQRELEYQNLGRFQQGVVDYIGQEQARERWMGIYRDGKRIGHTGLRIEYDGLQYDMAIDSRLTLDLFGKGKALEVAGNIVADTRMAPQFLSMRLQVDESAIDIHGAKRKGKFFITGSKDGMKLFDIPVSIEHFLPTDGFFPTLPIAGLEVGQTYEVPMLDPIFQTASRGSVEVMERTIETIDGVRTDCLVLETRFRGMKYTSWVTPDGELLKQTIPPPFNVTLRRESQPRRSHKTKIRKGE